MNAVPDANRNRNEQTKEDVLLPSQSRHLRENRPESTLCGHPKQGIQGAWNQSLATWVELGFLGSLSPVAMFTLRMLNFLEPDFWLDIPPEQLGVAEP